MKNRVQLLLLQCIPGLLGLAIWQAFVMVSPDYAFFLGSPYGIAIEFLELSSKSLWRDIGVTAMEAILGFLAGSSLGTLIGLSLWGSDLAYKMSKPYLIALGSVPVFALGPVLIFWFGTGILSKMVLGFLATFVVAVVQAYTGATEADPNLLRIISAFGGTRQQMFFKVIVPSATIWVLAGVRLNIGMALLGAFIGEFISSRMGLGHLIILAEGLYNVNQIWVGCFCIVSLAMIFNSFTVPVERWAKRWQS